MLTKMFSESVITLDCSKRKVSFFIKKYINLRVVILTSYTSLSLLPYENDLCSFYSVVMLDDKICNSAFKHADMCTLHSEFLDSIDKR
jgi:hypothetical protein